MEDFLLQPQKIITFLKVIRNQVLLIDQYALTKRFI
jgi:hypothetical protein